MIFVDSVDEELLSNISRYERANFLLSLGGVVALYRVLAPTHLWIHNESVEALPSEKCERNPVNSRYDDNLQNKINK